MWYAVFELLFSAEKIVFVGNISVFCNILLFKSKMLDIIDISYYLYPLKN